MARKARVICDSGLYHVYFRGNCNIFRAEEDYKKFESIMAETEDGMVFYAYGLNPRDGHFFVKTHRLSVSMKKILTDYAVWFNKKYNRKGPLFPSRYKSEPADISYAAGLSRYIVRSKKRFGYSDFIRSLFESQKALDDFLKKPEPETYGADCGINSAEIKLKIQQATGGADFIALPDEKRAAAVNFLSGCGISKTSMAKYLGVSRGTVINSLERNRRQNEKKRREEIVIL